jgi:hypothetical protein
MSDRNSNPPGSAIWWLRHACPGSDKDALTGDLIERFGEGQTRGWFWRQVFIAFIVSVRREVWRHWPHFCYAFAGTIMIWLFSDAPALRHVPGWLHWSDLPWPWSQLAFDLCRPALLALATLSILAAGLVIERSFHWLSLLRTGIISLALITVAHYSIVILLLLLRPPRGVHENEIFIIVGLMRPALLFFAFLVAAWLGRHSSGASEAQGI